MRSPTGGASAPTRSTHYRRRREFDRSRCTNARSLDDPRLHGQWRIAAADDTLLRNGVGLDYDHDEWAVTQVPGHWQSDPDFAHHDGPFLYRRDFDIESLLKVAVDSSFSMESSTKVTSGSTAHTSAIPRATSFPMPTT